MADKLSNDELQAIRQRCEAATPGYWTVNQPTTEVYRLNPPCFDTVALTRSQADSEFIAHAREDVPTLLAEVERLQNLAHDLAQRKSGGQKKTRGTE